MAVLTIKANGRVNSVCGNCGDTVNAPIGSPPTVACCQHPARFRKSFVAIWAEGKHQDYNEWGFRLFSDSWVEVDDPDRPLVAALISHTVGITDSIRRFVIEQT